MKLSIPAPLIPSIVLCISLVRLHGAEIANSTAEFNSSSAPGTDGWTYGYRDYTADGGGSDYGINDFIEFDVADGWTAQNNRWDWAAGDPPYLFISAFQAHPELGSSEHWAIRRWEAEITEPTPLAITWFMADANAGCGKGATGSIHLNGTLIHSHTIAGGDAIGATHTVYVNAAPGDVIDLALSPENADGTRGAACDSTFMSMLVNTTIPENPVQPDGSQFVSASGHSFNYQNPVVVAENALVVQENITNFITNYRGNPILRYNIYPNQSSNLGLFTGTPSISATGILSFSPRQGVHGTATLAFDSQDNSGGEEAYSSIQTVTITITPVNFPPTFSGGGDQNVLYNEGLQTIPNFISGFSPNDVEQSLVDYSVTSDNNAMFATQPDISNTGTLTFSPAIGGNGSATVSVTASDDGADNNISTTYQFTITVVLPASPIHYVSSVGSNTFPYHSPATAAHSIQDAVDAAEAGDTVQVADGTYTTGGRAAAGENLANRVVIDRAITVRSENGSTFTTIAGAYGTGADAPLGADAIRGVHLSGGGTLEGFTILGGSTISFPSNPLQDGRGGGIFISGTGSVINCLVTNCHSSREGAGIANDGTPGALVRGTIITNNSTSFTQFGGSRGGGFFLENATVEDCFVTENSHASTGSRGGGGYLAGNSSLTGTSFSNNGAANGGGVLLMESSEISGCTFSGNFADENGGGVFLDSNSSPVIPVSVSGCTFTGNVAVNGYGGGIYTLKVPSTIAYTKVQGNYAEQSGGGIFVRETGHLDHCLVTGNISGNLAGGAFIDWGSISSSTFSGNTAANDGGALVASSIASPLVCVNTIISANEAGGSTTTRSASIHQDRSGFLSFQNCLVENSGGSSAWSVGSNYLDHGANLDADPVFQTPISPSPTLNTGGDFHLDLASSPALDAGESGTLSYADQDLDGSPRVRGINIDMGVYENNITNPWTGLAGSDWATPQNWEDGVPGTFKELYFPANASSFQVDLDGPRNADVINIESDQAYTFHDHFLTIGRFLGAEGNTTHQLNSNIFLEQDNEWRTGAGTIIQANEIITDGGTNRTLTKTGSGRLELHGPNEFEGGLNHEDGSLALFNDNAAGLGPITASLLPTELVQTDFNSGSGFRTVFSDGFFVNYNTGDAHFNGTSDAQRTNLLTVKGDFINTDFVSEVTVTVVSGATAYFGFGDGSRVAPTYEPLGQPHVFARLSTGDLIISDNSVDIDPPTSSEVGAGTHRVRMIFDRAAGELTFAIHQNYAGGPFIPTTTFDPIDCSDNAFTDSDSRVFFGGNKGVRFDDFVVQSTNDSTIDLELGSDVTISNPMSLARSSLGAGTDPLAVLAISGSGSNTKLNGTISESGTPFALQISGFGSFTLGGQNTYTGGTLIQGYRFNVTGTTGSGPVLFTNPSGGTLGGTGTIAGPVSSEWPDGFRIAPGIPVDGQRYGTLTLESPLSSEGYYTCDIDGLSRDQLIVNGNLNLTQMTAIFSLRGAGLTEKIYVIAEYGSLSGQFAEIQGLPSNYAIDYAYNDGTGPNHIALVQTPGIFTFVATIDDDFMNPGNWTGNLGGTATPSTMGPVDSYILAANSTLNGSASLAGNLTINTGTSLSIGTSGSLTLDDDYDLSVANGGLISVAGSFVMNDSGSRDEPATFLGTTNDNQGLRIETTGTFRRVGNKYSEMEIRTVNHGAFLEEAGFTGKRAIWKDLKFTNSATGTAQLRAPVDFITGSINIDNAGTLIVLRDLRDGGQPIVLFTNSGVLNIIETLPYSSSSSIVNTASGVINGEGFITGLRNFGIFNLTGETVFLPGDSSHSNEANGTLNQGPHQLAVRNFPTKGNWNSNGRILVDGSLNIQSGGILNNDGIWAIGTSWGGPANAQFSIGGTLGGTASLNIPVGSSLALTGGDIACPVIGSGTNSTSASSSVSGSLILGTNLSIPAGNTLTVASGGTLALNAANLLGTNGKVLVNGSLVASGVCEVQAAVTLDHPNQTVLNVAAGASLTTTSEFQINSGIHQIDGIWNYFDSLSTLSIPHPTTGSPATTSLTGSGSINMSGGTNLNLLGNFQPGPAGGTGHFTVLGNLVFGSGATTTIDVHEFTSVDSFSASGSISLNGQLQANFTAKPFADPGRYEIAIAAGSLSGSFPSDATVGLNALRTMTYTSADPGAFTIASLANPYDEWAIQSGLDLGVNSGKLDDPNNDGIPNITHFALDTDPLGSGSTEGKRRLGTTPFPDGDHLTLTIPVRVGATFSGSPNLEATIDGITYHIQGSSDLASWLTEVTEVIPAQSAGLPPLRDIDGDTYPDWEYRTFTLENDPLSGGYLRVGIAEAPTL